MASILQCIPIRANWDRKVKARCVHESGYFLGQAIPNIVIDLVLLLLPLHPLWKLHIGLDQKVTLLAVFALGYLYASIWIEDDSEANEQLRNPLVAIMRLVSFIQLENKTGTDINRTLRLLFVCR